MSNTKTKQIEIKKDANIANLVFAHPEVADVLLDYGLHCVGCFASAFDTIEDGAKVHQMSDEEIEEMMERIQEVVNHGE